MMVRHQTTEQIQTRPASRTSGIRALCTYPYHFLSYQQLKEDGKSRISSRMVITCCEHRNSCQNKIAWTISSFHAFVGLNGSFILWSHCNHGQWVTAEVTHFFLNVVRNFVRTARNRLFPTANIFFFFFASLPHLSNFLCFLSA